VTENDEIIILNFIRKIAAPRYRVRQGYIADYDYGVMQQAYNPALANHYPTRAETDGPLVFEVDGTKLTRPEKVGAVVAGLHRGHNYQHAYRALQQNDAASANLTSTNLQSREWFNQVGRSTQNDALDQAMRRRFRAKAAGIKPSKKLQAKTSSQSRSKLQMMGTETLYQAWYNWINMLKQDSRLKFRVTATGADGVLILDEVELRRAIDWKEPSDSPYFHQDTHAMRRTLANVPLQNGRGWLCNHVVWDRESLAVPYIFDFCIRIQNQKPMSQFSSSIIVFKQHVVITISIGSIPELWVPEKNAHRIAPNNTAAFTTSSTQHQLGRSKCEPVST
jgi:hypothetical protein